MTTKSVRTYPQANIESLAEDGLSLTPHEMACMLEEAFARNFIKPQPFIQLAPRVPLNELISNDPVMGSMAEQMSEFAQSRVLANAMWQQKLMIYRNFGRYGLEKDEIAIFNRAKDGLETVEERLAAACYAIEAVKSRKTWKKEQNRAQDPEKCRDMTLTYDLPPRTKGKSHQPAFYSFTSPKGVKIDLFLPQGNLKRKLCKNPNEAFRAFMTRRGITINGGEVEILNRIMGEPMVEITNENGVTEKVYKWLPSYETTNCGAWFVKVGWRLNPKCTASSYWLDANGVLTQRPQGDEPPLSISQLDYEIIKGSAEEKLETEEVEGETEVADFMNDEEEYILSGLMRDESDEDVPIDNFVLIGYAYENNRFIEHRNDSAIWKDAELRHYKTEELRKLRREKRQLARFASDIEDNLSALELERIQNDEEVSPELLARWNELHKMKQRIRNHEKFFIEQCRDLDTQTSPCYSPPESKFEYRMRPTDAQYGPFREIEAFNGKLLPAPIPHSGHEPLMEKVKTLPCMTIVPDGDIEPETTFIMSPTRYMNRKVISCTLDDAKQLRRRKAVENSITHNRFGMLIREKTAANVFASTLDALLS